MEKSIVLNCNFETGPRIIPFLYRSIDARKIKIFNISSCDYINEDKIFTDYELFHHSSKEI